MKKLLLLIISLLTNSLSAQDSNSVGSWLSLDLRVPFLSIVDGRVKTVKAQKGSIQMVSNLGLGVGLRYRPSDIVEFYGGVGGHIYLSYLHAYTLYSSPLLTDEFQTEIEQYYISLGPGSELGVRIHIGQNAFISIGCDFAWDIYAWQDTHVVIEDDPVIYYDAKGVVPGYSAFHISPSITWVFRK